MKKTSLIGVVIVVGLVAGSNAAVLDAGSEEVLAIPALSQGVPGPGKRVKVTTPEYAGTEVFHTVYLPEHWTKGGGKLPVIFEYTGNYSPKSGSTGEPEDGGLGYGLSGRKFIWVSLPYVSEDHSDNAVTWWGDEEATVQYAKVNVPRVIDEFDADASAVILCGFSRGAIGVNYIGLHDDEISSLWTAFITHDHFDGVKAWSNTEWGKPLSTYREGAAERLKRVGNRPYLISQNGKGHESEAYIRSVLPTVDNFTFSYIDTRAIFGVFPNELAKGAHTDRWPLKPSQYRKATWEWMNRVTERTRSGFN